VLVVEGLGVVKAVPVDPPAQVERLKAGGEQLDRFAQSRPLERVVAP
jgi:hypothetical protein